MKREIELTVKSNMPIDKCKEKLKIAGYTLEKELHVKDIYMRSKDVSLQSSNEEILKRSVLVRDVVKNKSSVHEKELVYKEKEYNEKGEIVSSNKYIVHIDSVEKAVVFLEKIGYVKLLEIEDMYTEYSKGEVVIGLQDVKDLGAFIEVEETIKHREITDEMRIREDLKQYLLDTKLDIDASDFDVKKVFLALDNMRKRK
ncbi:MAG: hypothetical protein RR922_01225 [Clostridia bacterium]